MSKNRRNTEKEKALILRIITRGEWNQLKTLGTHEEGISKYYIG